MRKLLKKASLITLGSLCAVTCLGGGALHIHGLASATLSDVEIQETYTIGQTVNVPNATITVGGTAYETTKTLVYPNGNTAAVESAVIRMSGEYEIVYKALVNGKLYEKSVNFNVLTDRYSVSSERSSVSYGTNAYFQDETIQGLNLSLAQGDSFTYNRVLDLNKITAGDELIRFYYTPTEKGTGDVNQTYVKLTDVYNPENYVLVQYNSRLRDIGSAWDRVYVSAKSNGQAFMGLEYTSKGTIEYGGNKYRLHANNFFGLSSQTTWTGEINPKYDNTFADNYNYLKFNYETRQLYVHPPKNYNSRNMIIDLDDPLFYGDNLWKGFTTGEVIMSIYCENYAASTGNFFISDIIDGELTEAPFKDETAPELILDMQGYEKTTLPKAFVGESYRLFEAKAYDDLEGIVDVEAFVYYNYGSANKTLVQIKDGAFTPKREGAYTIVYQAKDSTGNVALETLEIACQDKETELGVVLASHSQVGDVMSEILVAKCAVLGANGAYKVDIHAVLKADESVRIEIDSTTRTFVPNAVGVWEVVYTASDYTHTVLKKYDLEVESVALPVLTGNPSLPAYLVKGVACKFESFDAYDFSSETAVKLATELYVKEDTSETQTKIDGSYIVQASNQVTLIYKATNANGTSEKEVLIPVIDVKYGNAQEIALEKYFYGKGFVDSIDENKASYVKAYDGNATANLSFINNVNVNEFTFTFGLVENLCNFETFDLLLTSVENPQESLKITFTKTESGFTYWVNDYTIKPFAFGYQTGDLIDFYYNRAENLLMVNGGNSFALDTEKGLFEGFTSNLATFSIVFNGVSGDVGVDVNKLLKQSFTSTSLDFGSPTILARELEITSGLKGETLKIARRDYFDLLDTQLTIEFSVYDPNGDVITATDGTELYKADYNKDYEILLSDYGVYYVQYKVSDFSGNSTKYGYQITVKDFAPPTVEIVGGETRCKVGDVVKIASVTIADDAGEASYSVVVIKPNGDVLYVVNGQFEADVKGEYCVYYTVFDESNNATQAYYVVVAS